jgi:hypothetical protein
LTGSSFSNIASTMLKSAVFAPMPRPSDNTAIALTPFCLSNIRAP